MALKGAGTFARADPTLTAIATLGGITKSQAPQEISRTIILLGSTAEYPATNPAASDSVEMSTNKQVIAGSKFAADTVDRYAQWRFRLPYNYKASAGFSFRPAFMLKTASGASTSVIFGCQALIVGNGGSIDTEWGTAVEVTSDVSSLTENTMIYASASSAVTPAKAPSDLTIVGGEEIIIRIYRKGTDTSTSDVLLTDVYMIYTTDNYEDA